MKGAITYRKDPSNEKVQEQLFAVQQRMDAMSAWKQMRMQNRY